MLLYCTSPGLLLIHPLIHDVDDIRVPKVHLTFAHCLSLLLCPDCFHSRLHFLIFVRLLLQDNFERLLVVLQQAIDEGLF